MEVNRASIFNITYIFANEFLWTEKTFLKPLFRTSFVEHTPFAYVKPWSQGPIKEEHEV